MRGRDLIIAIKGKTKRSLSSKKQTGLNDPPGDESTSTPPVLAVRPETLASRLPVPARVLRNSEPGNPPSGNEAPEDTPTPVAVPSRVNQRSRITSRGSQRPQSVSPSSAIRRRSRGTAVYSNRLPSSGSTSGQSAPRQIQQDLSGRSIRSPRSTYQAGRSSQVRGPNIARYSPRNPGDITWQPHPVGSASVGRVARSNAVRAADSRSDGNAVNLGKGKEPAMNFQSLGEQLITYPNDDCDLSHSPDPILGSDTPQASITPTPHPSQVGVWHIDDDAADSSAYRREMIPDAPFEQEAVDTRDSALRAFVFELNTQQDSQHEQQVLSQNSRAFDPESTNRYDEPTSFRPEEAEASSLNSSIFKFYVPGSYSNGNDARPATLSSPTCPDRASRDSGEVIALQDEANFNNVLRTHGKRYWNDCDVGIARVKYFIKASGMVSLRAQILVCAALFLSCTVSSIYMLVHLPIGVGYDSLYQDLNEKVLHALDHKTGSSVGVDKAVMFQDTFQSKSAFMLEFSQEQINDLCSQNTSTPLEYEYNVEIGGIQNLISEDVWQAIRMPDTILLVTLVVMIAGIFLVLYRAISYAFQKEERRRLEAGNLSLLNRYVYGPVIDLIISWQVGLAVLLSVGLTVLVVVVGICWPISKRLATLDSTQQDTGTAATTMD